MYRFIERAFKGATSVRPLPEVAIALVAAIGFIAVLPATASAAQSLTVTKNGAGTGTVTSSPAGIACGSTCSASFTQGTAVTLTATPGPNTQPVAWLGCDSVDAEGKCTVTMSEARSVTATFKPVQRQLTVVKDGGGSGTVVSTPAGINCGAACQAGFSHGTTVALTGSPSSPGQGVQWTGCDSVNGSKCTVTMNAARSVTATFDVVNQMTVTRNGSGTGTVTSSPAGIDCGSTCSAGFLQNATVTLAGASDVGVEAVKWSGCDSVTPEGKCLVAMNAAKAVTATFNLPGFQLSVSRLGSGIGTVTSSPAGIECGSTCSESFVKGSTVTLAGTVGLHSEAVKWAGCDTVNVKNQCLVAMNAARSVVATFDLEPQWIEYSVSVRLKGTGFGTVTSSPGGIDCGFDCTETYVNKTRVTLIATPAPGSVFDHWSGGSCAGTGPCEKTINSSRLVNAVFVAVGKRALTVSKQGSGQGTVASNLFGIDCGTACSAEYEAGTKVTLKATAAAGSTFTGWSGGNCSGASTCKLMLNEARDVTATFTANPSPPPARCVVPRLAGKTLAKARRALTVAHCALGTVRRPTGAKLSELRVRSSSPAPGTVLAANAKVAVRLGRVGSRRRQPAP